MFVVADGMGAHAAGELASKMAADGIPHNYYKLREESSPDAIRKTMRQVNEEIHRKRSGQRRIPRHGDHGLMLVLLPQGALVAHVGDSRVYRLRGGKYEHLTFDHSLLWEMRPAGNTSEICPTWSRRISSPVRSARTRMCRSISKGPFPLEVGDTFLMCSDGLSGQVKDEEMGVIMSTLPPAEAAQVLIDLANLRGGPDNITVLIVRITGPAISARANAQAAPLAMADERAVQAAAPPATGKFWFGAGILLAAAVGLSAFEHYPVCRRRHASLAVGLATWGFLQRMPPENPTAIFGARRTFGPRSVSSLGLSARMRLLVTILVCLIDQLREAATDGQWSVDWTKFNAYSAQGKSAIDRRDYSQAVREYSRALRFMMNELR